jgi:phospholipid/cholesterol/gamma-HCH transport system substrate-binding protein
MYSKVNYTVVGVFVLLFGAGLIWFAFWLAKFDMKEQYDTYKMYFTESVAGLAKDSTVKLKGVDVGRVAAIRIDPRDVERVEVLVKIRHGVPIKADMVAHVEMIGVTGLLSVVIDGGTNSAPTLQPKPGYIPVIKTRPSWFFKAKQGIGALSEQLTTLLEKSQKIFTTKNIQNIDEILENTKRVTQKAELLESKAIESLDEVRMTIRDLNSSMHTIEQRFGAATDDFHQIQNDFHTLSKATVPAIKKIEQTTRGINRVTRKVERGLDRGDYNLKKIFEPLIIDTSLLTTQINSMIREMEESPSDVIFKSRKPRKGPGE